MRIRLTSCCAICALLYGEIFAMYHGNGEQNNLFRSSSSSSISSSNSDSDSDSDIDKMTFSTNTTRKPEYVQIPCPDGDSGCEVYHAAFYVYSKELNTRNSQDLEWLGKGYLFPNLEQLRVTDDDFDIVARKIPLKKLKMLEVSGSIKNIEKLIKALSKTPNLEELILINTEINQKLGHIVNKLVSPNLIKKVTLQDKDFAEIPDPLLVLPNIEQITINDIVYDQTVIEKERNSRGINTIDKEKLVQAVKEGYLDRVKQQIREIDLLDLREDLFKIAVSSGQTDVLKFLINNRVDINARYENGNTLLMEAAQNNYFDVAKELISRGANVRAKNKEGKTAFSLAIDKARKDGQKKIPIKWIKLIKLLGNNGADLNEKDEFGESLLFHAIMFNDVELVKVLLTAADTKNVLFTVFSSYKSKTPLNNQQINELRDSAIIDVNEKSKHTDGEFQNGNTLLMYAIKKGHSEIVKLLLDHGANIEAKNEEGNTTLGFAASMYKDDPQIIKMLLDYGADINARNNEGATPLINAVKNHNFKSAIFLIDKGADTFIKNNEGETILSLAENIVHEHNNKGEWSDFVAHRAEKIIEKIKALDSH